MMEQARRAIASQRAACLCRIRQWLTTRIRASAQRKKVLQADERQEAFSWETVAWMAERD